MVQGAPLLGDGGTDIEAVHAFYDFWGGFKSWREFDVEDDELDVEQATWRGEKRWMEREIEREKKKLKNKENKRIRKLVDRAYANDPRIKSATHTLLQNPGTICSCWAFLKSHEVLDG